MSKVYSNLLVEIVLEAAGRRGMNKSSKSVLGKATVRLWRISSVK